VNSNVYIKTREADPGQALLKRVQNDELGQVEVLLCCFPKYPLQEKRKNVTGFEMQHWNLREYVKGAFSPGLSIHEK